MELDVTPLCAGHFDSVRGRNHESAGHMSGDSGISNGLVPIIRSVMDIELCRRDRDQPMTTRNKLIAKRLKRQALQLEMDQ